jgi:hypothetical protein
VPDPHLYFQAPGGQCLRLVGIHEDLSFYEGAGEGPNVAKIECLRARGRSRLPYLFHIRARIGGPLGHVPVARPRPQGTQ